MNNNCKSSTLLTYFSKQIVMIDERFVNCIVKQSFVKYCKDHLFHGTWMTIIECNIINGISSHITSLTTQLGSLWNGTNFISLQWSIKIPHDISVYFIILLLTATKSVNATKRQIVRILFPSYIVLLWLQKINIHIWHYFLSAYSL